MPRPGLVFRPGLLLGVALCLVTAGAGRAAGSRPAAPPPPSYAPHEILIKFRPHADHAGRDAVREQVHARRHRTFRSGAQHWKLPQKLTTDEAIARLRRHPLVEYVEPNHRLSIDAIPDDPLFPEMWGLRNTGQTGGAPGADIDAERAWGISTGSRAVLVAVIDTGVDYTHPDLAANIWTHPTEVPGNGADDDGNGCVDDVHGCDFINGDGDPMDDNGHGTHVAGTIGAVGHNAAGVAGVAWEVSLLPLKFLGSGGFGNASDAVAAIDYATDQGADVMNNSWGGGGFSQTLLESIRRAQDAGALFVVAAGNSGFSTDGFPNYPANYDVPNVVSVAATDAHDALAVFSNFGRLTVDLAAPGVSILSTFPGDQYVRLSGTSMAAPHVSGVAALMRSLAPHAPADLLRLRLMDTVDPLPGFSDIMISGGRLNAFTAMATRDDAAPGEVSALEVVRVLSNSIELRWLATGDDGSSGRAAAYDVRYSASPLDPADLDGAARAAGAPRPSPAGEADAMDVTGLAAGTIWHIAVRARDEWGNAGPPAFVTATTLPPPTFSSDPGEFLFDLPPGGTASASLTVRNTGEGSLDWSILPPASAPPGPAPATAEATLISKDDPDPRVGEAVAAGAGGPDRFGYRFDDSRQPGGPAFQWTDPGVGTEVLESLTGDDQVSGEVPLGFLFPFYGRAYESVRVSTNGWIALSDGPAYPVNQPLPSAAAPGLLIAPFWDDLDFGGQPRARVARRAGSLVVEYRDVGRYRDAGRYTFRAEMRATGEILFQYLVLDGPTRSATIGIQDAAVDALQVAFNAVYAQPELAVRVRPDVSWWSAAPASGRLMSGEQQQVSLEVSAAGLSAGIRESALLLRTNDPLRGVVPHALVLRVAGEPGLEVQPAAVDFGDVPAGLAAARELRLINTGTQPLDLVVECADPSVAPAISSAAIAPGGSSLVQLSWLPAGEGTLDAVLEILGAARARVPLRGRAVPAAGLSANPAWLREELGGETITRSIRLTNTTAAPLALSIAAEPGEAPRRLSTPASPATQDAPAAPEPAWLRSAPSGAASPSRALYPPRADRAPRPIPAGSARAAAAAPGVIVNGGFETGSFEGWEATHNGAAWDWSVQEKGAGVFWNSDPVEGMQDAMNGFDGEAGTRYTLEQDIAVPTGVARAVLSYQDRIQFDGYGIPSTLPRVYESAIRALDGLVLAPITRQEILLAGQGHTDRGWARREVDLAPYAGRTVRLVIEQSVPESWTGPAQIEFDDFRLDITPMPDWIRVAPAAALIEPGASLDLLLTLDASRAPSGLYRGAVRLDAAAPAGLLRLPVSLTARAIPHLEMLGGPIHVASAQSYASRAATTRHVLTLAVPPEGGGVAHLEVEGSYSSLDDQTASLDMEGLVHLAVSELREDCAAGRRSVAVDAATLARLAADKAIQAVVRNDSDVHAYCPINEHRVALSYRGSSGEILFPGVFAGDISEGSVEVFNTGEAALVVQAAAGDPLFRVLDERLVVPPGHSGLVKVQFRPLGPGEVTATLHLSTNDPLRPVADIALRGDAVLPPVAHIEPGEVEATLLAGAGESRTLVLSNRGGSPLTASLSVRATSRSLTTGATACHPERLLVSEFDNGALVSIDLATGATTRVATGLSGPNRGIVPLQDGAHALVVESHSGELSRVDLATGQVTTVAHGLGFPTSVVVTPDETTAYVADAFGRSILRVNLATGDVSSVPVSFDFPNALALDRDGIHLFVADFLEGGVHRVDPLTGETTTVAQRLGRPNDLALDPQGEVLYVVETIGQVAAVNLLTGTVTRLVSGLTEPVGIGVDAEAVWLPEYSASRVLRIDRLTGAVSILAYGLIGPVGAAPEGSCARFATVTPRSAALAAGESTPVELRLDAADLTAGVHTGLLRVAGNDPRRPALDIPLRLTVLAAPDIDLRGESVRLTSTATWDVRHATTVHEMDVAAPVAGPGVLELVAAGDFGDDFEFVDVVGEGGTLLLSAGAAGADCAPVTASFVVPESLLAGWAVDGMVRFEARNQFFVDPICGTNEHRLTLTYPARADLLDFGTVFLGSSGVRRLTLHNRGNETLEVGALAGGVGFSVAGHASVPARQQAALEVTFVPAGEGEQQALLTLETNDPDEPVLQVPLRALALGSPRLEVSPGSLDVSTPGDAPLAVPLTVSNEGASPLSFSLGAAAGPGARSVAVFEELPASPVPLTAVAADPSTGFLYAQENQGRRFFRFDSASRVWSELSAAPIESGPATGAALLGGRVYTTSSQNTATMGVYDIAGDAWTTRDNPLHAVTATLASDGVRYLYLAAAAGVMRLDPQTSEATAIPPAPFPLSQAGGMKASLGMLYTHQGNGLTGFAVFDTASGFWTLLPDLPAGSGLGSTFDPVERAYYAQGSGSPYLFRFDLAGARWNVHRIPGFTVLDGGLTWLPTPEPAVYVVEGKQGTGFARLVRPPAFVTLSADSGVVPAAGRAVVQVGIDPTSLSAGTYRPRLEVASNDPARERIEVPVRLEVAGVPRLEVAAESVRRMSFLHWSGAGAVTRHSVQMPGPPGGQGVIDLYAEGDFDSTTRVATLSLEGTVLGAAVRDGPGCEPARGQFTVPREMLEQAFADGVAELEVRNAAEVGEGCQVHRHTVVLTYPLRPDRLEFGEVRLGASATRSLQVRNTGTALLDVTLSAAEGSFRVDPPMLRLPPDSAAIVTVRFQPDARGPVETLLTLASNAGRHTVELAARGYEPPRAVATPASIRMALPPGAAATRGLDLRNLGERPLQWFLATRYSPETPGGGGPDEAGYFFRDSDHPGGPVFSWEDIAGTGTNASIFRDDETRGPVPLGFAFPFYGQSFSTVNISTNGFLSFTSLMTSRFGGGTLPLPGTFTPENLIAPLWTDLDFLEARRAWYRSDGERFIVQYDGVALKNVSQSSLTFQVILHRSGRIVFQYLSISQTPSSVTIGIQNGDRSIGLLVSGSPAYLHDRLAVEISAAAWLTAGMASGELAGDSLLEIPIGFDAARAGEGDHFGRLSFNTNDPVRPAFDVPVTLHVGEIALDHLDIDPGTVNPASRGRTVRARLQLPAGYDSHAVRVSSLRINGSLPAVPGSAEFVDETQDGVEELLVRFDRQAFEQLLSPGDNLVTLTGEVEGITWFRGSARARQLGPRVVKPNGAGGVVGNDTSDGPFILAAAPRDPRATDDLTLELDAQGVRLRWIGPAGPRRILWSGSARGPFLLAGLAEGWVWRDHLPDPQAGRVIFYVLLPAPESRDPASRPLP